jgi:hypothetical protein
MTGKCRKIEAAIKRKPVITAGTPANKPFRRMINSSAVKAVSRCTFY